MIAAWRASRHDLPLGHDDGMRLLAFVFAVMAYVAAVAALGLVVLSRTAAAWEHSLTANMTLEIPAEASEARLKTALALLHQTPGILSVHLLEPAETARLVEPWLGPSAPLDGLPVPRLIDLRIDPDIADFAALRHQLASVVPNARLDDHAAWLAGVQRDAKRIAAILTAAVVAAVAGSAGAAMLAARIGLGVNRPLIELLHLLGAADRDIAAQFAGRALRLGLLGAAAGALGILATVLALGHSSGLAVFLPAPVSATGLADWRLWAVLAAIIAAAGIIAMMSARLVVLRLLARMP